MAPSEHVYYDLRAGFDRAVVNLQGRDEPLEFEGGPFPVDRGDGELVATLDQHPSFKRSSEPAYIRAVVEEQPFPATHRELDDLAAGWDVGLADARTVAEKQQALAAAGVDPTAPPPGPAPTDDDQEEVS